ncbi:MAG: hypothetical protein D6675_11095 [Gemmatimonadetes bacterium]|nr:MAG: hypothetical protein D6675_11095 [Gemmatimonadota bacterium]
MPFLPRGTVLHTGLETRYIHLERTLKKLKLIAFSGYLRFQYGADESLILIDRGDIGGSVLEDSGNRQVSKTLQPEILAQAQHRSGEVTFYELSPEVAHHCRKLFSVPGVHYPHGDYPLQMGLLLANQGSGAIRLEHGSHVAVIFAEMGRVIGLFRDDDPELLPIKPPDEMTQQPDMQMVVFATPSQAPETVPSSPAVPQTIDFRASILVRDPSAFELANPTSPSYQSYHQQFGNTGIDLLFHLRGQKTGEEIATALNQPYHHIEPILHYLWEKNYIKVTP